MKKDSKFVRSIHHVNSTLREIAKFNEFEEEARQYTDSVTKQRKGHSLTHQFGAFNDNQSPFPDVMSEKPNHPVKPKNKDHKGGKTIRKVDMDDDD